MPSTDREEAKEGYYSTTYELKIVADYARVSFEEALNIECTTYKLLLVNAFIERCMCNEEGKQYLEDAYRLTRSSKKANRKTLIDVFT